jgi:hypothetical protein
MAAFDEIVKEVQSLRKDIPTTNGELALVIATRAGGGRGWRVFPCHETHKIIKNPKTGKEKDWIKSPYGDLCPNGYKDATKNPTQIRAWWNRWPGALVGIACDKNMMVLDLDVGHKDGANGIAEFDRLNKLHNGGAMRCGVVQKTQSGGRHLFFALPPLPDGYKIPDTLGAGIDIKSFDKGYVCTGKLPDGGGYSWLSTHQNYLTGLCYPPLWIVQIIAQANAPKPIPVREYSVTDKPSIERVRIALGKVDKIHFDDYSLWIKIGMALRGLSGDGLALWHEFSKQSAKYDPEVLDKKWDTFKHDISIGYIFNLAKHP